jgi:hypothetical protein
MQSLLLICTLVMLVQQGSAFVPRRFLRTVSSPSSSSRVIMAEKSHVDHMPALAPTSRTIAGKKAFTGKARWVIPSVLSLLAVFGVAGPASANVIDQLNTVATLK